MPNNILDRVILDVEHVSQEAVSDRNQYLSEYCLMSYQLSHLTIADLSKLNLTVRRHSREPHKHSKEPILSSVL